MHCIYSDLSEVSLLTDTVVALSSIKPLQDLYIFFWAIDLQCSIHYESIPVAPGAGQANMGATDHPRHSNVFFLPTSLYLQLQKTASLFRDWLRSGRDTSSPTDKLRNSFLMESWNLLKTSTSPKTKHFLSRCVRLFSCRFPTGKWYISNRDILSQSFFCILTPD